MTEMLRTNLQALSLKLSELGLISQLSVRTSSFSAVDMNWLCVSLPSAQPPKLL